MRETVERVSRTRDTSERGVCVAREYREASESDETDLSRPQIYSLFVFNSIGLNNNRN